MGQPTDASTATAAEASRAPLDRWTVERAVKASSLAPPSRLLVHTLLTHVTNGTLVIPAKYAPSLTTLTKETGLSRSTVAEHLNNLEQDGWIDRSRPATKEALAEKARTAYRIKVPAAVLAELSPEPVQEPDQSGSWTSPGGGPAKQEDLFGTGPGAGLVREPDTTSPGAGLNPMSFPTSSSPSEKKQGGAGGKRTPPKPEEHPRFAEWYAAYPLHDKRPQAAKAFNKAIEKVGDAQILIDAAERYAKYDRRVQAGFIKGPAVWLNNNCWDDDIQVPPARDATGAGGQPSNGSGSQAPPRGVTYDVNKILKNRRSA